MARLGGTSRSANGVVIPSPTVTVYRAGTSTLARVYTTSALSTLGSNPFTGTGDGVWATYVHGGSYDLTLASPGYDTVTYTDVAVFDPNDAAVDIREYGAACDDTTDDITAINAAIAALPSTGGAVLIPGRCKITAAITDQGKDNVTLFGIGRGSRIRGVTDYQTLISLNGRSGWVIRDLYLYGPGNGRRVTALQEGTGVMLKTCTDCQVVNCWIENCGLYDGVDPGIGGVYLRESCQRCRVSGNLIYHCNNGITEDAYVSTETPYGNRADHNIIRECRIGIATDSRSSEGELGSGMTIIGNVVESHANDGTTERYGIRCSDTIGTIVADNHIRNVNVGIEVHGDAWSCVIANNTIRDVVSAAYGGHGIWIRNMPGAPSRKPNWCRIVNNTIDNAPLNGIFSEDGLYIDIDGNTLKGVLQEGIKVSHAYCTVRGNRVHEAVGHAIYVTGASGSTFISGNFLKGLSTDTLFVSDGIRIDATSGGTVVVTANTIWNAQATAGFNYGVNQPSGPVLIELTANKFFRVVTPINPTTLATAASYSNEILASNNEATWTRGKVSELITLSTVGTTTDSTADLPGNSIIRAVVARVTTTIVTATDWKLGDPTTAGRFSAASTGLAAGSTVVGTVHVDQTGAAGPRQVASAKLRITTTGTPSAGQIRVTWFYDQFAAPTS